MVRSTATSTARPRSSRRSRRNVTPRSVSSSQPRCAPRIRDDAVHDFVLAYFAWLADPDELRRRRVNVHVWAAALADERLAAIVAAGLAPARDAEHALEGAVASGVLPAARRRRRAGPGDPGHAPGLRAAGGMGPVGRHPALRGHLRRAARRLPRIGTACDVARPAVVRLARRRAHDPIHEHEARAAPCTRPAARGCGSARSSSSGVVPGRACTTAVTRSPQRSSGTPTTTASNTAGCDFSADSTSSGYTFSPPVLIDTEPRPSTVMVPSSSMRAWSPGTDQRTPSITGNVAAVFSASW